jgi:hypothetical protein
VCEIELPETLEDIVVWKLEHADQVDSYLHHVQMTNFPWCSGLTARELVTEWLVRIWPLGIVTSAQTYSGELSNYHCVSVAGILVCTVDQRDLQEIRGETHA